MIKFDNNAYLIQKKGIIDLHISMKLGQSQLQKSLPLTIVTPDKTHLGAYFSNGQDYLGAVNVNELTEMFNNTLYIDLLNNKFETIKTVFPNLTEERYMKLSKFAEQQINYKL